MSAAARNILIIEDEALLALELELSLKDMGHSIAGSFITGEEALTSIEINRPDVVLVDIKLGGQIDGIETARRIRLNHDIPVVFMTGNADRETLRRVDEFGPTGVILKPLTESKLNSVLKKAFS